MKFLLISTAKLLGGAAAGIAVGCLLGWLLTGCSVTGTTTENPNFHRFNTDTVQNPSVLLVGDSIVNAWCSATLLAQNPTWACQGSPAGVGQETSTEVLARFQKAISASPKTIVIEVGTWDLNSMGTDEPNVAPCESVTDLCSNVKAMVSEATNAGIQVIVCGTPPWGAGPAATDNGSIAQDDQHDEDISDFNVAVLGLQDVTPIDMYAVLAEPIDDYPGAMCFVDCDVYLPSYTPDGVIPNTAGANAMTAALQTALATPSASIRR